MAAMFASGGNLTFLAFWGGWIEVDFATVGAISIAPPSRSPHIYHNQQATALVRAELTGGLCSRYVFNRGKWTFLAFGGFRIEVDYATGGAILIAPPGRAPHIYHNQQATTLVRAESTRGLCGSYVFNRGNWTFLAFWGVRM